MNAKEKATAIVKQFWMKIPNQQDSYPLSIQCAIIHVKGIIEELESIPFKTDIGGSHNNEGYSIIDKIQYWRDVLTELNQM